MGQNGSSSKILRNGLGDIWLRGNLNFKTILAIFSALLLFFLVSILSSLDNILVLNDADRTTTLGPTPQKMNPIIARHREACLGLREQGAAGGSSAAR